MTGKKQAVYTGRSGPKQPASEKDRDALARLAPAKPGPSLVQRGLDAPGTLVPGDLVQLQRTVGNQAVTHMLNPARPAAVQRKKDQEARGEKQQRVTLSRRVINQLKDKLRTDLSDHVYKGKPFKKAVDKDDPQGLHAYTNGALANDMEAVGTHGSTGRVHSLTWKYRNKQATKDSTMFPKWMPGAHINTLIALNYADDTDVVKEVIELADLPTSKAEVLKHISHGQTIKLGKSGETVYPEM
jgi:hypothetical protein